jgi:hypothetical protein
MQLAVGRIKKMDVTSKFLQSKSELYTGSN